MPLHSLPRLFPSSSSGIQTLLVSLQPRAARPLTKHSLVSLSASPLSCPFTGCLLLQSSQSAPVILQVGKPQAKGHRAYTQPRLRGPHPGVAMLTMRAAHLLRTGPCRDRGRCCGAASRKISFCDRLGSQESPTAAPPLPLPAAWVGGALARRGCCCLPAGGSRPPGFLDCCWPLPVSTMLPVPPASVCRLPDLAPVAEPPVNHPSKLCQQEIGRRVTGPLLL